MNKPITQASFLHADGTGLTCAAEQDRVVLRGTDLSGWLFREGKYDGGGMYLRYSDRANWRIVETMPPRDPNWTLAVLTDGDPGSRWDTGALQTPETAWITWDMGEAFTFNHVELDCGASQNDYPGGLRIEASDDGETWRTVASRDAIRSSVQDITFDDTTARYLRAVQTGSRDNAYWSVSGLQVRCEHVYDDAAGRRYLQQRFGDQTAAELLALYRDSYLKESDLDALTGMGLNCVRVPLYWRELLNDDHTLRADAFTALDTLAGQCAARGIYVVPVLAAADLSDGMDEVIWAALAAHFADNPVIAGYDLLDTDLSAQDADRLYRVIRAADAEHVILLGTAAVLDDNEQVSVTAPDPADHGWEQVAVRVNCRRDDSQGVRDAQLTFARQTAEALCMLSDKLQLPVVASRFTFWSFLDVMDEWLSLLERSGIGWTAGSYKNATPRMNDHMGLFVNKTGDAPDYAGDELSVLQEHLQAFDTASYTEDTRLTSLIRRVATHDDMPVVPEGALDMTGFTAHASDNDLTAMQVLEPNRLTGWYPFARMQAGQWFAIDMKQARTVTGVVMDAGGGGTTFPHEVIVQVSLDGKLWDFVCFNRRPDVTSVWTVNFEPRTARYVRLMQTAAFHVLATFEYFEEAYTWGFKNLYILGDEDNRPPVFVRPNDPSIPTGQPFTMQLQAEDADGDVLTFSAVDLPQGAELSPDGLLAWTPVQQDSGFHHMKFTVTDGKACDEIMLTIEVCGEAELPVETVLTVTAGDVLVESLRGHNVREYRADRLPEGCVLHPLTGVLMWSPTAADAGDHTFTVYGEGDGTTTETQVTVTVTPAAEVTVRRTFSSEDMTYALSEQPALTLKDGVAEAGAVITVDRDNRHQPLVGFGNSLDGSSLYNLTRPSNDRRHDLINTLFHPTDGANWNFMRICFGTPDFAADEFYTYDDMPTGETDPELKHFSIQQDRARGTITFIREMLAANPAIKLLACVWSPPAWMKQNDKLCNGGHPRPEFLPVMAQYYVKAIQAYAAEGIPIYAVTLQNEPDIIQTYPTCNFTLEEYKEFLKCLRRAFNEAGLDTKIWILDANFPEAWRFAWPVLGDEECLPLLDGVAGHDYDGDPYCLSEMKSAYPGITAHVTERSAYGTYGAARLMYYWRCGVETYNAWLVYCDEIGQPTLSPLDAAWPPQTVRSPHREWDKWYCTSDFYLYAQVSKFVRQDARYLETTGGGDDTVNAAAFENPDGSVAVTAVNRTEQPQTFTVRIGGSGTVGSFSDELPPKTVATYLVGRK